MSLRDLIVTRPPSTRTSARTPSHFISYAQCSSSFGRLPSVASIGRTSSGIGCQSSRDGASMRWIIQFLPPVWNSTNLPSVRSPCSTTLTSRSVHFSVSYVPWSQIVTWPAPYSPWPMLPSNVPYSSGWSSTWTARWLRFGSSGTPLGTAHETSTPSRSRRKSQCSEVAWCSWTTNESPFLRRGLRRRGIGSLVRLGSRLRRYSSSGAMVSPSCCAYASTARQAPSTMAARSAVVVVILGHLAMLLNRVGRLGLQGKGVLRLL